MKFKKTILALFMLTGISKTRAMHTNPINQLTEQMDQMLNNTQRLYQSILSDPHARIVSIHPMQIELLKQAAEGLKEAGTVLVRGSGIGYRFLKAWLAYKIGDVTVGPFIKVFAKKMEQFILRPNFVSDQISPKKDSSIKRRISDPRNEQLLTQIINHSRLVASGLGKKQKLTNANILLIGKTGNGKTEFAKQLGHELNTPVTIVNCAELAGKYSDALAVRSFLQKTKGIIYINEADFLLQNRSFATPEQLAIFTTVLSALNTPNDKQIFIVDTNTTKELDPGMIRRFPTQVYFENPTQEMREQIIQLYVNEYLKPLTINNDSKFVQIFKRVFPKIFLRNETNTLDETTLNTLFSSDVIKFIADQTENSCGAHLEDFVKSVQSKILTNNCVLTKEMIKESLHETQKVIKRSMQ